MLKNLKRDSKILLGYLYDLLYYRINKLTNYFKRLYYKRQIRNKSIMELVLEYEGVSKIGGEFMGERYISKLPVVLYRLRRNSSDDSDSYIYVCYIDRSGSKNPSQSYQVVLEERWDLLIPSIKEAIRTNKKAVIGIRIREGGTRNGKFKSNTGRRIL